MSQKKTKLEADEVQAAGKALLHAMKAAGFVGLAAGANDKLMTIEFADGCITSRQRVAVEAVKALLELILPEGETIYDQPGPDDGKEVTVQ